MSDLADADCDRVFEIVHRNQLPVVIDTPRGRELAAAVERSRRAGARLRSAIETCDLVALADVCTALWTRQPRVLQQDAPTDPVIRDEVLRDARGLLRRRIQAKTSRPQPRALARWIRDGTRATPYPRRVESATAFVPATPKICWRLFTDSHTLTAWIPGLRRAQVIAKERGLPAEIHFEFASALVYTLVYAYDVDRFEVRWEPKLGRRDGVTGFARFEAADDGTRMTYGLEQGEARTPAERAMSDPNEVVAAFVAFVAREAR